MTTAARSSSRTRSGCWCGTCPVPCPCRPRTVHRRSTTPPSARPPPRGQRCRPTWHRDPSGAGRAAPVACPARRSAASPLRPGRPSGARSAAASSARAAFRRRSMRALARVSADLRALTASSRLASASSRSASTSAVRVSAVATSCCASDRASATCVAAAAFPTAMRLSASSWALALPLAEPTRRAPTRSTTTPRTMRIRRRPPSRSPIDRFGVGGAGGIVTPGGGGGEQRRRVGRVRLRELVLVHRVVLRLWCEFGSEVRRRCDRSAGPPAARSHRERRRPRRTRGEGPDRHRGTIGRRPQAHLAPGRGSVGVRYLGSVSGP